VYAIKSGRESSAFSTPLQMSGPEYALDWRNREGADGTGKRIIAVPPQVQKVEVLANTPFKG